MLHLLDLFSGIGGFSLGLERSGHFRTVAFCEIDPWPRGVLRRHWPDVPIYEDVRDLTAARLRADGIRVDAMCGGFPCQDVSLAGGGAGLDGERSGLWREYARLAGELRPSLAIVENVGALTGRGLARVLADLASIGMDAQWHVVPAVAVGAPHLRDRCWIVAVAADSDSQRREQQRKPQHRDEQGAPGCEPDGLGTRGRRQGPTAAHAAGAGLPQLRGLQQRLARALAAASAPWERTAQPPLRGLDDGLPRELVRHERNAVRALGNAVVPAIPEILGRCVMGEFA